MFERIRSLVVRDDSSFGSPATYGTSAGGPPAAFPHAMIGLLITLLILLILSMLLIVALLIMRQRRRARNASLLPVYDEKRLSTSSTSSSHRRVMVRPSESVYVYQEKQNLMDSSNSPPPSPIPEIRITFPEEIDDSGKRKSGRVVVVRVSENGGVGLEPVEGLPSYQEDGARFHSIDLERVGGLVEKARNAPRQQQ